MRTLFILFVLCLFALAAGCQLAVTVIHGDGNSQSVATSGWEWGEGDGATSMQPPQNPKPFKSEGGESEDLVEDDGTDIRDLVEDEGDVRDLEDDTE